MIAVGIDIGGTSIKGAMVRGDELRPVWTGRSGMYARPGIEQLTGELRVLLAGAAEVARGERALIGLCAPGLFDAVTQKITRAVNMPALVGLELDAFVESCARESSLAISILLTVCSDAVAAATDYAVSHPAPGRLLGLSLGTGVGAAVLDDGVPLCISGQSPGHIGQLDVAIDDAEFDVPIGPDGGRGGLEGYIGLPALRARHPDLAAWFVSLKGDEPELRALAHAIRICHAIYRPQRVVLIGGVGIGLREVAPAIKRLVDNQLTSIAREGWTLGCGDHDHHAAAGAARLAFASKA